MLRQDQFLVWRIKVLEEHLEEVKHPRVLVSPETRLFRKGSTSRSYQPRARSGSWCSAFAGSSTLFTLPCLTLVIEAATLLRNGRDWALYFLCSSACLFYVVFSLLQEQLSLTHFKGPWAFSPPWADCCHCSVPQSCLTPCDPMDCSTPVFPVLHCILELAQTRVHGVNDAVQPSHPVTPLFLLPSTLSWSLTQTCHWPPKPHGFPKQLTKASQIQRLYHCPIPSGATGTTWSSISTSIYLQTTVSVVIVLLPQARAVSTLLTNSTLAFWQCCETEVHHVSLWAKIQVASGLVPHQGSTHCLAFTCS